MTFCRRMAAVALLLALPLMQLSAYGLYSWYGYEGKSYNYLKKRNESSRKRLMESYESMISKQKGDRAVVPPGVYADYGWMLIQDGSKERGKEMLRKEMELYPESSVFINRVLKRFEEDEKKN